MKLRVLLKGPLLVSCGYGSHARELFRALTSDSLFDVSVENTSWGNCSFLTNTSTAEYKNIRRSIEKRMVDKHKNNVQYDLFVHVTIPNEFERLGKFNIGVTAGIETDRVSHVWIQKCNEMDLIIVPSEHSKKTLAETIVDWQNPQTGQSGQFKLNKPIIVCPEGFDPKIFVNLRKTGQFSTLVNLDLVDSDFNFLHVGQWGRGGYGEDRKNISLLVKYFIETFRGRKDVGLILKINMARNSSIDYNFVEERLNEIKSNFKTEEVPPIYLLHANLTEEEMSALYNHPKVKAFISLSHGEGFCRPALEAAACGLPVMMTNWSGQLDFLNLGKWLPFEYELKEIPDVAVWENILIKGSAWACVKETDVKSRMQKIVSSYDKPSEWALELSEKVKEVYSLDKVCENLVNVFKQNLIKENLEKISPKEHLESFMDTPDSYNVIYTMPMSAGDVYISTAVIDGLCKELPAEYKIYFATQPKYMDILKNNPHVYKVISWNDTMMSIDLLESVFDLALTPNIATQYTFSNWVRRGQGRLLAEEFANHCHTQLGDYFIEKQNVDGLPENYMTIHTTSGKGQWEGRNYLDWKEVLSNLKNLYPDLKVVQVGIEDEPKLENVDVDLRGKTNYQQLACVLEKSMLHLSPDTFSMHLSVSLGVPAVALFGCSYATSTGPWVKDKIKAKYILLQSERLSGCKDKACYKNRCAVNPDGNGPISEIDPKDVFNSCARLLKEYENE